MKYSIIIKLDLSKEYDKGELVIPQINDSTYWSFYNFVDWVEECYYLVSLSILIKGYSCPLFHYIKCLRKGCPLFPLLFLLV